MDETPRPLEDIRREIDALDHSIHDALMARAALVAGVRQAKGAGGAILRPGREAAVLRRLVARHRGDMDPSVVVRIWREIMTASSRQQGPFSVAVATAAAGGAGIELARDHFGTLTALQPASSIAQAIHAVTEAKAQAALVPLAEDVPHDPWWRSLGIGPGPQLVVIARLPFARGLRAGAALLVGRQDFDPSGEDRGFVIAETRAEISQARLGAAMAKHGLPVTGFPASIDDPGGGSLQLVELGAYVAPGDGRLAAAAAEAAEHASLRVAGGYAVPLDLAGG
ncbi:MAG: chorismate mutase [Alphaproteobacteria bacterium]